MRWVRGCCKLLELLFELLLPQKPKGELCKGGSDLSDPSDPTRCTLEPANRARRGHPRTAHYAKMSSKGRIELQIGVSGAEICEEPAGEVHFCVATQKPIKNSEKLIFRPIFQKISERVRVLPNASRRVQTHPNASERVRAGPSNSENLEKLAKTCENFEKLRKNFENFREKFYKNFFHGVVLSSS